MKSPVKTLIYRELTNSQNLRVPTAPRLFIVYRRHENTTSCMSRNASACVPVSMASVQTSSDRQKYDLFFAIHVFAVSTIKADFKDTLNLNPTYKPQRLVRKIREQAVYCQFVSKKG